MPEVQEQRKDLDPNLRPEWLVRKSQKPAENSRIEKRETNFPEQRNQIVDQVNSVHRDESENLQWNRIEKIFLNRYMFHKNQFPKYPNQMPKPIPKLPERVIHNEI